MAVVHRTLVVKNLSLVRNSNILFKELSFKVSPAEILWIHGPNGSGKSTLMRLLAGITTTANGVIQWNDSCIHANRQSYREQFHYLGHSNGIKPGLTVFENLTWMCALAGVECDSNTIANVLLKLELASAQNQIASTLSAGQKRRLGLAKLSLLPRPLWILDEPFTALDTQTHTNMRAYLEAHIEHGGIAIISSHQAIPINEHINSRTLRLEPC